MNPLSQASWGFSKMGHPCTTHIRGSWHPARIDRVYQGIRSMFVILEQSLSLHYSFLSYFGACSCSVKSIYGQILTPNKNNREKKIESSRCIGTPPLYFEVKFEPLSRRREKFLRVDLRQSIQNYWITRLVRIPSLFFRSFLAESCEKSFNYILLIISSVLNSEDDTLLVNPPHYVVLNLSNKVFDGSCRIDGAKPRGESPDQKQPASGPTYEILWGKINRYRKQEEIQVFRSPSYTPSH